jgi:hypothetical protein
MVCERIIVREVINLLAKYFIPYNFRTYNIFRFSRRQITKYWKYANRINYYLIFFSSARERSVSVYQNLKLHEPVLHHYKLYVTVDSYPRKAINFQEWVRLGIIKATPCSES